MLKKQIEKLKYKIKMFRNLSYINRNSKNVIKNLQKKIKTEKLNVVFYVYDSAKWKCQTLYDLFIQDEQFNVKILVTRSNVKDKNNSTYQSIEDIKKTYDFFANKNMNVEFAYDFKLERHIPFIEFKPDIIIYQHPWYVETSQGPVVCSKFALTYYVPYFVANAGLKEDYYLRFHQYIHKHYLLNQSLVDYFSPKMENKGRNLVASGHPQLDFFYLNNEESTNAGYVIYAPHWTFDGHGLSYGTFEWNGKFILEFAKQHSDINWIFKPHPLLKKSLVDFGFMTTDEVNEYYSEWNKIGKVHEDGDYLSLFVNSKAMITDCGSFLTEYFLTKKPLIRIVSGKSAPFCPHCVEITKNYYEANNLQELQVLLDDIIINENDYMKNQRCNAVEKSDLANIYAAKNIIDDIKKEVLL